MCQMLTKPGSRNCTYYGAFGVAPGATAWGTNIFDAANRFVMGCLMLAWGWFDMLEMACIEGRMENIDGFVVPRSPTSTWLWWHC